MTPISILTQRLYGYKILNVFKYLSIVSNQAKMNIEFVSYILHIETLMSERSYEVNRYYSPINLVSPSCIYFNYSECRGICKQCCS